MPLQTFSANEARSKWRDMVDAARMGETDIVIERYGQPLVVVIPYEDYVALAEELGELRAARRAERTLAAWQQDPSRGKTLDEVEAELRAEGVLDA